MKLLTTRWRTPLIFLGMLLLIGVLAPAVSAAPGAATATVTPGSVPAGTTRSYTFTLTPTSGQASSFNLTAPSGWSILSLASPPPVPAGVTLASSTVIQGRGLSITSSSPLTVAFTAQAPCAAAPNVAWTTVAKSGPNFTGASITVNPVIASVNDDCTAAFVEDRGPAAAAFNGGARSENITSDAYSPSGAAMQVLVTDAADQPRAGISIKLELVCEVSDCDDAATLTGPNDVTATSGAGGIATFTGTASNPIAIDRVGIGYQLDPTGSGVDGELSDPFGIWEEGEDCASTCEVHGRSDDRNINATVSADTPSPLSDLSVLVTELGLNCGPSIPSGYEYTALSADVIAWRYTGDGSQTITVRVGRDLLLIDRGSAHIDVCYLAEPHPVTGDPKTFTDKFGVTSSGPGLLPDCDSTVLQNCILSQTAGPRGSRIVTFTVEDGRGKI